jgi:hypothetical protein
VAKITQSKNKRLPKYACACVGITDDIAALHLVNAPGRGKASVGFAPRAGPPWYGSCLSLCWVSPTPGTGTGLSLWHGPNSCHLGGWGQPLPKSVARSFMPGQEAHGDCHLKRVASDAHHWHNWLERLAELRRAREDERLLSPAENSPDHAIGPRR